MHYDRLPFTALKKSSHGKNTNATKYALDVVCPMNYRSPITFILNLPSTNKLTRITKIICGNHVFWFTSAQHKNQFMPVLLLKKIPISKNTNKKFKKKSILNCRLCKFIFISYNSNRALFLMTARNPGNCKLLLHRESVVNSFKMRRQPMIDTRFKNNS